MESNNQEQLKEEEIPNLEQFQVDRSSSPDDSDAGYTDQEVQFADGEGTPLNEELLGPEDEEDEEDIVVDDPDEDEIISDDPDEDLV